jgi:hypothetical protein
MEDEKPTSGIDDMRFISIAPLALFGLVGVLPEAVTQTRARGKSETQPAEGASAPAAEQRYGPKETARWFRNALTWDGSPIDLSFLNASDRPAGSHGVLKAVGDRIVFADGTAARFWGNNVAAYALFATPRQNIARQAHRIAELGYNLVRIVHHDAPWAPNIFDKGRKDTRHFDPQAVDSLDLWIKCLKDEGIYVWIDLVYQRTLTANDGVTMGFDEIKRQNGYVWGFSYFNDDVRRAMAEFQHQYLSHVNRYTRLAYKDDPAVVGVLITNENDLTVHFGNIAQPDKNNPVHNKVFMSMLNAFCQSTGLPANRVRETWLPGPSKIFLNDVENRFNQFMIEDLRALGVRAPLSTTSFWGDASLFSLPSLTAGDLIDAHSYGRAEELNVNPRNKPNFITAIGASRVQGKPLSITEWNVPYPTVDRFTAPLYLASIASLQGWEMPMIYNYSQATIAAPGRNDWDSRVDVWSTYADPAISAVMPAAAVAFRQGHISPARTNYCLMLNPDQLFNQDLNPKTSATIRTLVEQSKLTIGLPAVAELPWLKPTETPKDATIITDPNHDFIPPDQSFVRSDTGELLRNWKHGIQTINTAKTQAVNGWVGGKTLALGDSTIRVDTNKAVVALTSLDDLPLSTSHTILITAVARAVSSAQNHYPMFSEPVACTINLRTKTKGLQLLAVGPKGQVVNRLEPATTPDGLSIRLPAGRGTHWYLLKVEETPPKNATRQ